MEKKSNMKTFILLIVLCVYSTVNAQNIRKKCKSCGKPIAQCQYKGAHPTKTPSKSQANSASKNRKNNKTSNSVKKNIVFDGMEYTICNNEAALIKGKADVSIVIPDYVTDNGKKYPVTSIDGRPFFHKEICDTITSIILPQTLKIIKSRSFQSCVNIRNIYIPSSVQQIEEGIFYDCDKLENIIVDSNNKYYDSRNNCNAIIEKKSKKLVAGCKNSFIPDGIRIIGEEAFAQCNELKNIIIPEGVVTIDRDAFFSCDKLNNITLPTTLRKLGDYAFFGCKSLKKIILPNSITTIPDGCFEGCGLTEINITANINEIHKNPFYFCDQLVKITIDKNNPCYTSYDNNNVIIDKRNKTLVVGCCNSSIPMGITTIGEASFEGCKKLKKIVIPNSVNVIGSSAFECCSELESISLPNSLESIQQRAFHQCYKLTDLKIPFKVKEIDRWTFTQCKKMEKLYVPEHLQFTSDDAVDKHIKIIRY